MRRRVIAAAALALLAGAACGVGPGSAPGASGHLRVVRKAGRTSTVLDEPGRAEYCSPDSILTIIALGRDRAAGFAARAVLPLAGTVTFDVKPELGGAGTATAAFRLPSGSARLGVSGRLRLTSAGALEGDFEIALPDSGKIPVRYEGALSGIPVHDAPASCAHP